MAGPRIGAYAEPLPKPAVTNQAFDHPCQGCTRVQALGSRFQSLETLQRQVLQELEELRLETLCGSKSEGSPAFLCSLRDSGSLVSEEHYPVPLKHVDACAPASASDENDGSGVSPKPKPSRQGTNTSLKNQGVHSELKRMHVYANDNEGLTLRQRLVKFANGPLDVYIGILVAMNTIVMMVGSQYDGIVANASLGLTAQTGDGFDEYADVFEHVFLALYIAEIIFRMAVLRRGWLLDEVHGIMYSNIFDAAIVLSGVVELYILSEVIEDVPNMSAVRWLRLLRVAKTLRLVRMSTLFRQLRILVKTIIASVSAVVWSLVVLLLAQVTYALIPCQALHTFIVDDANDYESRIWVNRTFGSFSKSLYSMFEITFSGGWPNLARPVIEKVSAWYAPLFLSYVVLVLFACIKVITALFIKETMSIAASDSVLAVQERMRSIHNYAQKLQRIFELADTSGDGLLSREEFHVAVQDPVVASYFAVLDIEINEVEPLFELLNDGDDMVTIDEFCKGLTRLKGQARALDVVAITHEVSRIGVVLASLKLELERWVLSSTKAH
eukprot:TRINITY_DN45017_c0_g1_i1.p1 TRINITY_DN45017_c0_g1~~TRINITY_DN45017_c0_g1_i1.p1  ORF type:complete len:564 (-),score=85.95 TRINITY_DN45017_c0_g1_i1:167-1831(-)